MKIKEMETEKLISLLCGDQFMNTKALPEYDIPSLEMSDGPMGLRYQKKDKDSLGINRSEPATCLPAGSSSSGILEPGCSRAGRNNHWIRGGCVRSGSGAGTGG